MSKKTTDLATTRIRLDGTLIRSDGSETTSDYFQWLDLPLAQYSQEFTPAEVQRIRMSLTNLKTGSSAALPLTCGGRSICPFASKCIFVKTDLEREAIHGPGNYEAVTPVGLDCQIEVLLMNEWTRAYVQEFEIPPSSKAKLDLVRELVECEILLWRLHNNLSKPENAELVQEVTVGVNQQGEALTRQETSAFFDARERLQTRKTRLIKLMVGDPQEEYKRQAALRVRDEGDTAGSSAALKNKLLRLKRETDRALLRLQEASGDILDVQASPPSPEDAPLTPEELISKGGD
jgi:hypothetical protein